MLKQAILLTITMLSYSTVLASNNIALCLTKAYPEIKSVQQGIITFNNQKTLAIGQVSNLPFSQRLNKASVADQLSQSYPLNFSIPKQYQDAGRLRNDDFFKFMYGASLAEVNKNMVSVYWKPANSKVKFNRLNGASEQLQKVGNEIANDPTLVKYVNQSLGTLNFRKIAGTNRLSSHSFGVAIDFQLPKHLHKYWRWDGCKSEDVVCPYPKQLMTDEKLQKIVKIFEKHGFIWGGKWASYDSVHFEYRPELLIPECRKISL